MALWEFTWVFMYYLMFFTFKVVAIQGHGTGEKAPGMKGSGILEYKAAHNLIRAHAKAYRVYQNEFAVSQQGNCNLF